ncbi:MAG TPA: hypothetical protein VKF62_06570 [Planctomycetota bacterium]|nr:hypothetical protein [Planctomycetota bacterium]
MSPGANRRRQNQRRVWVEAFSTSQSGPFWSSPSSATAPATPK